MFLINSVDCNFSFLIRSHSPFSALSQAQRRLSQRLVDFKFECIGSRQTDDELVIAGSLKEFGKLIAAIEDEKDRMVFAVVSDFYLAHWNLAGAFKIPMSFLTT